MADLFAELRAIVDLVPGIGRSMPGASEEPGGIGAATTHGFTARYSNGWRALAAYQGSSRPPGVGARSSRITPGRYRTASACSTSRVERAAPITGAVEPGPEPPRRRGRGSRRSRRGARLRATLPAHVVSCEAGSGARRRRAPWGLPRAGIRIRRPPEHGTAVRDAARLGEVVRHHFTIAGTLSFRPSSRRSIVMVRDRVERAARLVEEQHLGAGDERSGRCTGRCCWPPDRVVAGRSSLSPTSSSSPTALRHSRIFAAARLRRADARLVERTSFEIAPDRERGRGWDAGNTIPMRRRSRVTSTSAPSVSSPKAVTLPDKPASGDEGRSCG